MIKNQTTKIQVKMASPCGIALLSAIILGCSENQKPIQSNKESNWNNLKSKATIKHGMYGAAYEMRSSDYSFQNIYQEFPIIISSRDYLDTIYTDNEGFFEAELPVGEYKFCSLGSRCLNWRIDTIKQRCDYEHSSTLGWNCYISAFTLHAPTESTKITHEINRK